MKKNQTFADLSTSLQSRQSNVHLTTPNGSVELHSQSLKRAIQNLRKENRVAFLGIGQVPKNTSYFQIKQQSNQHRITNPSQEPKHYPNKFDFKKEIIKKMTSLKPYCQSQQALQLVTNKYALLKKNDLNSDTSIVPSFIEKINKDKFKRKSTFVKDILRQELKKRLIKSNKEQNYELDSMFKHYKRYSQMCLNENISKTGITYNGYFKIYNQSQKDNIFLQEPNERESKSDESDAYQEFLNEVDEATIQKDVYHNNIRNPFLDDKITVKIMRKDGFLKRRSTQI